VEQLIATRGDHQLPHEIRLEEPYYSSYSWGQHGTEDTKSHGVGSLNLWLGVREDASQLNTSFNVRVNIRRMTGWVYNGNSQTWQKIYDGLPTWFVSTGTSGDNSYVDVSPIREADGSYSFNLPVGRGLHMSSPAPGLGISDSHGVVSVIEARLLGSAADVAAAKLGMTAGADYRDAAGSSNSIQQAGFGQFGLLTANWKAFDMLSSTLTDDQVRLNPPPLQ
jgi:hypothetical protein